MTIDDLMVEAEALRRPCVYLTTDPGDGPLAGWWQAGLPSQGDLRTWLTVNASLVPDLGSSGFILLEEDEDRREARVRMIDRPIERGVRLFAKPGFSPPPVDAIFRFGGEKVANWLAELGWQRSWSYNGNFRGRDLIEAVERKLWWDVHPFYNKGLAHAVLGGWHFPWPDGDWAGLVDSRLVLWTFEDSEPWLEVWLRDGALTAKRRQT